MIKVSLIAHDGKKPEMVSFVLRHKEILSKCELYATGTTGGLIEREGFTIKKFLSGPKGGDAQIASLMAEGKMDVVIFFRDALEKHPHEPDVQMLLRLADVHNVALATNPRSANYILKGISMEV
jgi:methylglyoxal synthase